MAGIEGGKTSPSPINQLGAQYDELQFNS
jgi:hypothetical protein